MIPIIEILSRIYSPLYESFFYGVQCLKWLRNPKNLSGKRDSNPRPLAWEANALPTELLPLNQFDLKCL